MKNTPKSGKEPLIKKRFKKRKEVKLEKSLSPINVWALALGSIIGWGAFVMPGNLFLPSAGPLGTAIGLSIGAIIMSIIVISYGYMIKKFPVAGGEFAFSFEGFNRHHAFICSWFLGLSYLSIVPLNATALGLIGRYMFPGILQVGYLYSIAGWEVYLGEIILASIVLIVFAYTNIRGMKISGKLQTIMAIMIVATIFILTTFAVLSNKTELNNLKPLFSTENTKLGGILSIVAIAPWIFVGFDSIPQAAEEFNFPPRKALKIMIGSLLIGSILYIAMSTVTAMAFPWAPFINSNVSWATGRAVESFMGTFGLIILGVALLSSILAGILGFYMAGSRLLLSMARAKAIPGWFGKIHPKYKTPANSVKFILLVSLLAPWFGRQVLKWVVDTAAIGAAVGYFYTCASAFRVQRLNGESFALKFFSILGSILSIAFVALLIIPGMPSYLTAPSRIALIVWVIVGIIFYAFSFKTYNKLSPEELRELIIKE